MKKTLVAVGVIFLGLVFLSSQAYPWGSAVHAYIVYQLKARSGPQSLLNATYGGLAPDIFNYDFSQQASYLAKVMHLGFMSVWFNARTPEEKQLAYGFVSHNDIWGIDSTAHRAGITKYWTEGYVIGKAKILAARLKPQLPHNLQLPNDVLLDVCHNLVENAIDVLLTRVDSQIGTKVKNAALNRSSAFPGLLARSFWLDLGLVTPAEGQFQMMMAGYGDLLTLPEVFALQALTEQMTDFAADYLASKGISPVPPPSVLRPLIQFGHEESVKICEGDSRKEIEATIDRVNWLLKLFGINY